MDSAKVDTNYAMVFLIGIAMLTLNVVYFHSLLLFLEGIVATAGGGIGLVAVYHDASPQFQTRLNTLIGIGIGTALISPSFVGANIPVSVVIAAGTFIAAGFFMMTDFFSGAVGYGVPAGGFTLAAAAEVLIRNSLFGGAVFALVALLFAGLTIQSIQRARTRELKE